MNTILLQPTDVLFFRDGRPMTGSLAGHTAAWPLPDVTNHALHAALHRAGLEGVHAHRRGRSGNYSEERDRKFGSLLTAGPFPVDGRERWFFPRPKDAQQDGSVAVTLRPVRSGTKDGDNPWRGSSLPEPLKYAVANTLAPDKNAGGESWISADGFKAYLGNSESESVLSEGGHFLRDESIADREANLGIAIDPETQSTGAGAAEGKIYTAHYLRLRDDFRLGLFAEAWEKVNGDPHKKRDLLEELFKAGPSRIVVGGQQRVCTAELKQVHSLRLPTGLGAHGDFASLPNGKIAVKWVLLSPAVWPEIPAMKQDGSAQNAHPGGWLPNWVFLNWNAETQESKPDERNGAVLLRGGPGVRKSQRKNLPAGGSISARLVAAMVPKPVVVTGWALPNPTDPERHMDGGAKSTHLAVPAGAVYYFEANSPDAAAALVNALNWHGATNGTEIKNRRSTLMGEKGFGLGVCGTWDFFGNVQERPRK